LKISRNVVVAFVCGVIVGIGVMAMARVTVKVTLPEADAQGTQR